MKRRWTEQNLRIAVGKSANFRQVLYHLGLREAGGNYSQLRKYLKEFGVDTSHFMGKGWSRGTKKPFKAIISLDEILVDGSTFQSFKLKHRLFKEGLKVKECEECGWKRTSIDGRLPLELHHVNGNRLDNRIQNLKVLCPNCHSLCINHRGKNIKKRRDGETGRHATLKML